MATVRDWSVTKESVTDLYNMLMTMRPHQSTTETKFIKNYLLPLGVKQDGFGNLHKRIHHPGGKHSKVAWSCHTDTVHRVGGSQHIVRTDDYVVKLHPKSNSTCLGADDTAGVWLMCEMIRAKVPGLYIFHRGEECGGKGSRWIVKHTPELVRGIDYIIALDRKDNDSVITFQGGMRCCSDDFGNSLAEILSLDYKLDQGGSFTDSASYVDLIGECTNLSVGYRWQHSFTEHLNMVHLMNLREALLDFEEDRLVYKRKPGEKESRFPSYSQAWRGHHNYEGTDEYYTDYPNYWEQSYHDGYWDDSKWVKCTYEEWERWRNKRILARKGKDPKPVTSTIVPRSPPVDDKTKPSTPYVPKMDAAVLQLVKDNPTAIALMFDSWGFDAGMLREQLLEFMFKKEGGPYGEGEGKADEKKGTDKKIVPFGGHGVH